MRFVLENRTGKPIYLQDGAFWSLLRGNEPLRHENSCEYCDCATPDCAVCGRTISRVIAVPAGATHRWSWSGFDFKLVLTDDEGGIPCEQPEPVSPGTLVVRVVYSLSKIQSEALLGTDIGAPVTLDESFENPPAGSKVVMIAR